MKKLYSPKLDIGLLTILSAFPVLSTTSASAQVQSEQQQNSTNSDIPESIAPVEDESQAVFSPPKSQPDDLSDNLSDNLSDDLSDKLSNNLPAVSTECTDVTCDVSTKNSVGITVQDREEKIQESQLDKLKSNKLDPDKSDLNKLDLDKLDSNKLDLDKLDSNKLSLSPIKSSTPKPAKSTEAISASSARAIAIQKPKLTPAESTQVVISSVSEPQEPENVSEVQEEQQSIKPNIEIIKPKTEKAIVIPSSVTPLAQPIPKSNIHPENLDPEDNEIRINEIGLTNEEPNDGHCDARKQSQTPDFSSQARKSCEIRIDEIGLTNEEPNDGHCDARKQSQTPDFSSQARKSCENKNQTQDKNKNNNKNKNNKSITSQVDKTKLQAQDKIDRTANNTANKINIVTPLSGVTNNKTTNIGVEYDPSETISVNINGQSIDPKIESYIHKDETRGLHTKIWYKVPLNQGKNIITAQTETGKPVSVTLNVKQQKQKITIQPVGEPRIPADGRSNIELQGKITNENGKFISEDVIVTLSATAGKFIGADRQPDIPGFQVLARGGKFIATLRAGLKAQNVKVRAAIERNIKSDDGDISQISDVSSLPNTSELEKSELENSELENSELEAYTNVEFITNLRPSLATGSINFRVGAAGTDYWGSPRDFLNPDKINKGTAVDLDAAVFATGKVGDWLFTGAYNSKRPLNQDCDGENRLFGGIQSCEKQYAVYGDSSSFTTTAPSTDSVYARLERTPKVAGAEPDYVMWGDYDTQEFTRKSQLFTATDRQLHGFKGNYNFGNLQVTGLYANNIEGFQRDAIAPNGTSGTYFLSRRLVVPGSENVFIESEEINRPGTIVKRQPLSRDADYEIDYDRGSLNFRRPISATELNPFGKTLVKRIVVTYQNQAGEDSNLYAGRLQYNFRNSQAENNSPDKTPFAGLSYLREDKGSQDFELFGADFSVPVGNSAQIVGEYARSSHDTLDFGKLSGSAYRLEASGNINNQTKGQAYYRSVTENFANDATWSFTPGQTRYGASVASKISDKTTISLGYDREDNFGVAPGVRSLRATPLGLSQPFDIFNPQPQATPGSKVDNSLKTFKAGIEQKIGESDLSLQYVNRSRADRVSQQFEGNASQLVSSLNVPLNEALTFRAQNELNLSKSDPLYPNRTTLGLDWGVHPGVTLRLAHQFFDSSLLKGNSITNLDTLFEHKFSPDTSFTGRYSVLSGADGITDQGALGLSHRLRLAPGLNMNLGYERVMNNIFGNTAAGVKFAQPYAVGQSSSSLGLFSGSTYSLGVEYTDNPDFQANARLEYRDGNEANNTVISAAAAGKISPSLTAAARYRQSGGANQLLQGLENTTNLRLGLAYRNPKDDKFNALLGYEYRQNPATTPDNLLLDDRNSSTDHLFSGEAIYAPNRRWEFYGKYAFRTSTNYLSDDFTSKNNLHLGQLRASYQLGYRTDVALEGRWIGQPTQNYNEFGLALEGGYHLTPDLRVGVGYAFGSVDDRDFTGYRSKGGPYLNVSFKLNELFGGFGRQKIAPPQQQESVTSQKSKVKSQK